jgi:hypothetical protein
MVIFAEKKYHLRRGLFMHVPRGTVNLPEAKALF